MISLGTRRPACRGAAGSWHRCQCTCSGGGDLRWPKPTYQLIRASSAGIPPSPRGARGSTASSRSPHPTPHRPAGPPRKKGRPLLRPPRQGGGGRAPARARRSRGSCPARARPSTRLRPARLPASKARGEGRGVSDEYGVRDEACPVSKRGAPDRRTPNMSRTSCPPRGAQPRARRCLPQGSLNGTALGAVSTTLGAASRTGCDARAAG